MPHALLEAAANATGALLNATGIVLGGTLGLTRRNAFSPAQEDFLQKVLGAFATFYGLRLTWISISGPLPRALKQVCILLAALIIGRVLGRLMKIQHASNRIGQHAKQLMEDSVTGPQNGMVGFKVCTALFCAAPLGIIGAVDDGLSHYYYPLAVKAVMDGLAVMGLVRMFGQSVMLSAIPVFAWQGSIALFSASALKPWLEHRELIDAVNAVSGVLVFAIALVLLKLKRVPLSDYLPALVIAPVLAWIWR